MSRELKQFARAVWSTQLAPAKHQRRAVVMFKPAITLRREASHEKVVITGRAVGPKQGTDSAAQARKVLLPGGHRGRLKQTLPNPVMRHPSHAEVQLSQLTES